MHSDLVMLTFAAVFTVHCGVSAYDYCLCEHDCHNSNATPLSGMGIATMTDCYCPLWC